MSVLAKPHTPAVPLPGKRGHHGAQFYTDTHRLCVSVADFLGVGIEAGQPLIVIATPEHSEAILGELHARGFNVKELIRRQSLIMRDARDTLAQFMDGDRPNPGRFSRTIGEVIDRACAGRTDCVVRAYGEMVDVLWRNGNCDGAIRLEVLWNELARKYSFSLLCGYAMGNFYKDTVRIHDVCEQHTHNEILRSVTDQSRVTAD
jgi:hypothetical protein